MIRGEPFEAFEKEFDVWAGGPGQTDYKTAKNQGIAKYADQYPHCSRAYGAWAQDFLKSAKQSGKPFCMSISFKAPHMPYTPDPIDLKLYTVEENLLVHFWPFDGWQVPHDKSVIAEVYPSIFRNRYPREDRTADQQDACAIARWLTEMDERGALERYFSPRLTDKERRIADLEGWIPGIV